MQRSESVVDRRNYRLPAVVDKLSDYEDVWTATEQLPVDYMSSTMPPMTRLDPAKYRLPAKAETEMMVSEVRPSSPTVFRFDARRTPTTSRLNPSAADDSRPSPIYAEPCDRLPVGWRQRVAARRTRGSSVATPPISAGYRLPRDFLNFDGRDNCHAAASGVVAPPRGRHAGDPPFIHVSPSSTLNSRDEQQRSTSSAAGCVSGGRNQLTSVEGGVDRLRVHAAGAAEQVRRQRSNYDNVESDVDNEARGDVSRRTTVSSARTEYSPPWNADRWRCLVVDQQLCLRPDDVNLCSCDTQKSGLTGGMLERALRVGDSSVLNCAVLRKRDICCQIEKKQVWLSHT